jgi:hypothetical protein
MTSPRKVNNRNPNRHNVLKYLRENPQEFQYLVGDYLAEHPEVRESIAERVILKKEVKNEK